MPHLHLTTLSHYADGFPRIRHFTVDDYFSILVMDLLGESLEKVFESCKRQFTVKTICHLGRQMVSFGLISIGARRLA